MPDTSVPQGWKSSFASRIYESGKVRASPRELTTIPPRHLYVRNKRKSEQVKNELVSALPSTGLVCCTGIPNSQTLEYICSSQLVGATAL